MDYFCEICLKNIKAKNKYKHSKSRSHIEFYECKNILISYKDIDLSDVDEAFYLNIIEHSKKFDNYIIKFEFKLVFIDYQYCPYVMFNVSDNKTLVSWKIFLMIRRDLVFCFSTLFHILFYAL